MTTEQDILQKKMAYFEEACRSADLKLTHQRMEIFHELAAALDHPTAEALYTRLRQRLPTISLDTVYRTLATFEENNLIARVQTVESQARYEAEMELHHHAICRKCGRITDFQWTSFDATRLPNEIAGWGKIENKKVTLQGLCEQCAG